MIRSAGKAADPADQQSADVRASTTRLVSGRVRHVASVAVCIPVYQGGRYLEATVRSVLDQTWNDMEIVILDNASTDNTAEVLSRFDDPRLSIWRNPTTVPMAENFNRVIALSHAQLVKLLPADDLLEPRCLELQVAALRADPKRVLVVGRKHLVDGSGRIFARSRFVRGLVGDRERAEVLRQVVRCGANPIGGDVAVTFRRSAFLAAGGYRGAQFADLDLWTRLVDHGTLCGQAETVARFRVMPNTVSAGAASADFRALRQFIAGLAATEPTAHRLDVLAGLLRGCMARCRRELLFALARNRARSGTSDAPRPLIPQPRPAPVAPVPTMDSARLRESDLR